MEHRQSCLWGNTDERRNRTQEVRSGENSCYPGHRPPDPGPHSCVTIPRVNIAHLVSADRWTGAAAPALAEVEALRDQGTEAHYIFVGGNNLETRLAGYSWAHPVIEKPQNPVSFFRSRGRIREIVEKLKIDLLHAHLSYDHLLAAMSRPARQILVRTYHSRRTMRFEPVTQTLMRKCDGVATVNHADREHRFFGGRLAQVLPPPLDRSQHRPDGVNVRDEYSIGDDVFVIGFIGKVSPGRGFEEAIQVFSLLDDEVRSRCVLLIIGQGPHRSELEELTRSLRVSERVIWAGYHEQHLPAHYRAMDLLLFTAPGSDEGHRAVIEALGCGTPVAGFPIRGLKEVAGPDTTITQTFDTSQLARVASARAREGRSYNRAAISASVDRFDFPATAAQLGSFYKAIAAKR